MLNFFIKHKIKNFHIEDVKYFEIKKEIDNFLATASNRPR
jgi:hypothetical protein